MAQRLKCLPAMRKTWVRSLGWKDSLEQEMTTHSSILSWKISLTEEPGSPWDHNELDITEQLSIHTKEERVSPVAHWVKNLLANAGDVKRCRFDPWVGKIP